MDKLRDQYETLGQATLDKIKLTDQATLEVSFGFVPDESAPDGVGLGTHVIIVLKHNLLLGQPPIVTVFPIPSINLGADIWDKLVPQMLEDCRRERDRWNAQPMLSQGLPAGLQR